MRFGRYLSILGVVAILGTAAPSALAAPAAQVYVPGTGVTVAAAQPGLLRDLQRVFPWQDFQGTPLQVVPLDGNAYVVSHPSLFWPANAMATAQAVAAQLASMDPGWSTTIYNGPQGYGAYLTYQPSARTGYQAGLLRSIQQVLPWQTLQGTPLQVVALNGTTYVVGHPSLFWPANATSAAQAVAYQLAGVTPGWGTTVYNGPQGYGTYLTYQPWAYAGAY